MDPTAFASTAHPAARLHRSPFVPSGIQVPPKPQRGPATPREVGHATWRRAAAQLEPSQLSTDGVPCRGEARESRSAVHSLFAGLCSRLSAGVQSQGAATGSIVDPIAPGKAHLERRTLGVHPDLAKICMQRMSFPPPAAGPRLLLCTPTCAHVCAAQQQPGGGREAGAGADAEGGHHGAQNRAAKEAAGAVRTVAAAAAQGGHVLH